jgi:hypothetical protein
MASETAVLPNKAVGKFLDGLKSPELLQKLDWNEWLDIVPPYPATSCTKQEVTARYNRNGYDWDIHGSLYTPAKEFDPTLAFVVIHGGAGTEHNMDWTPDGRPGLARILATQGVKVLSITYPGHWAPGGYWTEPVAERLPYYLLDRKLSLDETKDRMLKCTFNVNMQGLAALVDQHLAGRRILGFGHSTGGPMVASLYRFSKKAKVIGITGFGSGGPHKWVKEWRDGAGLKHRDWPIDNVSRRSPNSFREAGYDDDEDLCPWKTPENYMSWADKHRSQIKTSVCDNQHVTMGEPKRLEEFVKVTGLPRAEFFDHLDEPDHKFLKGLGVILIVGENDKGHWKEGATGGDITRNQEMFLGRKYREAGSRAHVLLIPRYGHIGYAELYNEKLAYLWLWAYKNGFYS